MSSSSRFILFGLLGLVGYFLWTEYQEILHKYEPYLLLMLCPLMHILMHGSHKHLSNENKQIHTNINEIVNSND
ncbi:MAG: DUF2933 domain-containing protein [SAR324 cluster bacterium]|nr:DUF2933 domain-containing protein [SAR324 cluster bacterium]MBL7034739.1 DUF2933 domain-containing protein [SAR324 cluster bacterium]